VELWRAGPSADPLAIGPEGERTPYKSSLLRIGGEVGDTSSSDAPSVQLVLTSDDGAGLPLLAV